MRRLAVISDTHLPRGNRRLPQRCVELLGEADLILHAGDFSSRDTLAEIRSYGPLEAVYGNTDAGDVRAELPETNTVRVEEASIAMVHDAGPAAGRLERLRARFPDADAVVFGHSHIPLHEHDGVFQIFNPGSPTDRRRQPRHTMGMAIVQGRQVSFETVTLD